MKRISLHKYLLLLLCLSLSACTGTRHLPSGEKLYTGAEIQLESSNTLDRKTKRFIKSVAETSVRPDPNRSYWGIRPRLWMYMAAGDSSDSKFSRWLRKNGTAPVLISDIKPSLTASIIDAQLFNIGVFHSYTDYSLLEKKRTTKVIYISYVHKPYTILTIINTISNKAIYDIIETNSGSTILKVGQDYRLEALKTERQRIDGLLKNHGYFYFNPDYLQFMADTSSADYVLSLELTLKDSIPQNALIPYRINQVRVDQDYTLNEKSADTSHLFFDYQGIIFRGIESEMNIRPKVLARSILFKKGESYSRQNHNATLSRLMSMGNYKFAQLKFSDKDTSRAGYLDVDIFLTPMTNYTFRAELDIVSKSNNFTGPRFNISLLNRNTFKGAELLYLTIAGSYEAQLNKKSENLFSYSINPQVELLFPRFILPFHIKRTSSMYVPKTRILLSYNYSTRVNYFNLRTLQFIYGFAWKENIRKEHEFNPVNISYSSIGNASEEFTALLEFNPFLRKSYEERFIAGMTYVFSYNEQVIPAKKTQYFLLATAETAGNMFSLIKWVGGEQPSAANPLSLVGSVYSQFAKLSADGRVYYNFRNGNKVALRAFGGVAKPYMNSSVLPYNKQFFSGGPNSVRAFAINSLGPGSYNQEDENIGFLQLGGDIKLEMNGEYRFSIYRFFKGAVFADIGNVWLHETNPLDIGNPFMFSRFLDDLAAGAGVGLRIDVSFFVLRFDLAMPLRKPWIEENNGWVTNQIDFGAAAWRSDNLRLNIAIGYPF